MRRCQVPSSSMWSRLFTNLDLKRGKMSQIYTTECVFIQKIKYQIWVHTYTTQDVSNTCSPNGLSGPYILSYHLAVSQP